MAKQLDPHRSIEGSDAVAFVAPGFSKDEEEDMIVKKTNFSKFVFFSHFPQVMLFTW